MKSKLTLEEQDDLPHWKRKSLCKINDKAENIQRSEFWPDIAKKHGIRLAALVFKVAIKTAHKYTNMGRRGHEAGWNEEAEVWAKWIGLTHRDSIADLLKKAKKAKLLKWRKTTTGTLIWVLKTKLYDRITFDHGKLVYTANYYNHRPVLSLPATIILDKIKYYQEHAEWYDNQGVKNTVRGWQTVFPFLSAGSIKKAQYVLRDLKLVYRDAEGTWRLNKKEYTKYTAKKGIVSTKKRGGSALRTKVPHSAMVVPHSASKVPHSATKSAKPQQNLSSPLGDFLAPLEESPSPSPTLAEAKPPAVVSPSAPCRDEGHVRLRLFFEEDEQAKEKMKAGWKIPMPHMMTKTTDIKPEQRQTASAMNSPAVTVPVRGQEEKAKEEDRELAGSLRQRRRKQMLAPYRNGEINQQMEKSQAGTKEDESKRYKQGQALISPDVWKEREAREKEQEEELKASVDEEHSGYEEARAVREQEQEEAFRASMGEDVEDEVNEISSSSPVVSRKPKAGASTSPVEGAAAVPQAQEAKGNHKALSGSPPQAARPAGTDGQTKSMTQPAASSLHRDKNGKLRPVKEVAAEMEAGRTHEERTIQPERYEWAADQNGRPVKVAVGD